MNFLSLVSIKNEKPTALLNMFCIISIFFKYMWNIFIITVTNLEAI